ncbi:hotdog family protein [Nitrincola sp. MINF-07-Sa-05]|uniref:hotdog family protein n=1 Tax=Nitrincola salilacus TaxID=3400273 RepID=UPI0039180DDD
MITGYDIEAVLPHAHPMILLSEFVEAGESHAHCRVTVAPDSPFFDPATESVPSYVGVEYMAQTIAAFAGANALASGEEVKIGFLLGCRKYQPEVTRFYQGSVLEVRAEKLMMDESGLSVFACRIDQDDKLLVEARLNVFQPEDHQAWLAE